MPAKAWLGRSLDPALSQEEMVLRCLGAFGPVSVKDAQAWSGLTRLGGVFEKLRPRLATFRDGRGGGLFYLPVAPRPDPGTLAPERFLPAFDNLILSHADRDRIVTDTLRKEIFSKSGMVPATFLVGGFVGGTWRTERTRVGTTLEVRPFKRLSREDRDALSGEGERLLRFAAGPGALGPTKSGSPGRSRVRDIRSPCRYSVLVLV